MEKGLSLKVKQIRRIDLVPRGDNPPANIVIFKAHPDDVDNGGANSNKKGVTDMTLKEIMDSLPEEQRVIVQKELDDKDALVTQKEEAITAVTTERDGFKKDLDEAKKVVKVEPPVEDLIKSTDPAVQAEFKKLQDAQAASDKIAKDNAEEVKKMKETVRKGEFTAKAEAYKGLPMNPSEFGEVLMHIADAAPDDFTKLSTVLESADKAIVESAIFDEVGRTGRESAGSAIGKINKMAEERAAASGGKVTKEAAFLAVAKEHSELYEQYLKEREV